MNRARLEQCLWQRVRLRPVAQRRMTDDTWLPAIDDEWIPTQLSERGLRIQNARTHHAPLIGLDHIHHYVSDPERDGDGLRHGFLDLNVQLTLPGCNVFPEPLRRHRPRRRDALAMALRPPNQDGGAYMSLKHREKVRRMESEVIIAPADVANVVKALVEGANLLSSRGFYLAGFSNGQQELADALKKRL